MKDNSFSLPASLKNLDISTISDLTPLDLIKNPTHLVPDLLAAGRALVYARSSNQLAYDAIAFRTFAASPRTGVSPIQTSEWTALQREIADLQSRDKVVDELLNQQTSLRHRPLQLPKEGEDYRYESGLDLIHLFRRTTNSTGRKIEDRWTFSLTDLPAMLQLAVIDRDEPLTASQQLLVALEGTHWLPFSAIVDEGCFRKLQDIRSRLVRLTPRPSFNCFLSHRWLTPTHPDPDGLQARFTAWQLFGYLAEAVRVAAQRGLHQPRKFSAQLGRPFGPRGRDLAEALIVNVLRFILDDDKLNQVAIEVQAFEAELEDFGISKATEDVGLKKLKNILSTSVILQELVDHIFIWYDYSCLPQPPRTGDDVALFRKGLEELVAAQILGRTAIMLDDADDYLSRAWCTLEALVADSAGGAMDLLVGAARPSTEKGEVEHYFDMLLQDRPHVVWRAVLDTEVFGVQSPEECMTRLSLAVTDKADLPFIYERLGRLNAPGRIHIDDSEIVTGIIPLPAFEDGSIVLRSTRSGRSHFADSKPETPTTLDWSDALSLRSAWNNKKDSFNLPPFQSLMHTAPVEASSCHVAIIGACEGEAILITNWVQQHKQDLESLLSVSVQSISWVASDIAPIGHINVGTLEAIPVTTETWVVVAMSTRLQHCRVTNFITETLRWSGVSHATVAIDQKRNNVLIADQRDPPEGVNIRELIVAVNVKENPPKVHAGGLYQWQIVENLI